MPVIFREQQRAAGRNVIMIDDMNGSLLTQVGMKQAIVDALDANDFETVLTLALQNRKALSVLVRLAYDKDTLTGWRAIIAVGRVASVFVRNNYDFLRETARKLLWSLSDESGGIGWSAPEMLGEIVSADPKRFADVIPLIAEVYTIEEQVFRPGVLYALKRIAETSPETVRPFQMLIVRGLSEQDPLSRIYSLELVRMLKDKFIAENLAAIKDRLEDLRQDRAEAWVYSRECFECIEVGNLASEIYESINS
jgi:hypothetical protein